MAAAFSQSRVFRAVSSVHLAFLWSHVTSVLDEEQHFVEAAVAATMIVDNTAIFAVSQLGVGASLTSRNGSRIYLQFFRFSERVLAKDFVFEDIFIIGMMVHNCDCLEITEDQEKR